MKTLKDHNDERLRHYEELRHINDVRPNGIECPECKAELWDSEPAMTLTSNPPKKTIHCPACGYRGYRIA